MWKGNGGGEDERVRSARDAPSLLVSVVCAVAGRNISYRRAAEVMRECDFLGQYDHGSAHRLTHRSYNLTKTSLLP